MLKFHVIVEEKKKTSLKLRNLPKTWQLVLNVRSPNCPHSPKGLTSPMDTRSLHSLPPSQCYVGRKSFTAFFIFIFVFALNTIWKILLRASTFGLKKVAGTAEELGCEADWESHPTRHLGKLKLTGWLSCRRRSQFPWHGHNTPDS